jgi:hypothetical protein
MKRNEMNKAPIILILALILSAAGAAWAQSDANQTPAAAPVPAFGQETPVPAVSENPPISAIDQPGLEPHAAPESFLLPGLHFSESVESNVGNTLGESSVGTVTRGLASLTLQKLWKNYAVAVDYIGGAAYYGRTGVGLQQLQQLDIDNRINWKRGQLAIRDSFSYLPEGSFGSGAYGGEGAYNSSLGGLGAGMLGSAAFGGQTNAFSGGNAISLGQVPRLSNLGLADVVENLSPKSSVTLAAGYGVAHFYGNIDENFFGEVVPENVSFIGSSEVSAQVGFDRVLGPRDQVAVSYGYQGFNFSTDGAAFHSNVVQAMYGHRISGRMDFTIGAGPQFTRINEDECLLLVGVESLLPAQCLALGGVPGVVGGTRIGVAGRVAIRYKFPKTTISINFQRYNTDGSGIFAGALSNTAHLDARRPLNRIWDIFADLGYSKSTRLQLPGSAVSANSFSYGYGGVGLHRQFGRSLRGFVSYQFNDLAFDVCPLGNVSCSKMSQRQVGSIGLDWTPRPIRID